MRPLGFFDRRIRGFRVVELGAAAFLLVLVLVVYMAKTGAGDKRADIDRVQQQMDQELSQIRLLRAEVATLEQPERLEALSARFLNLQPVPAKREVTPEALADIARSPTDPTANAAVQTAAAGRAPAAAPTAGQGPAQISSPVAASAPDKAAQASNAPAPGERRYVLATATTSISPAAPVRAQAAPSPAAPKKIHASPPPSLDSVFDATTGHSPEDQR